MTARPRAVVIGMMGADRTRVSREVAHVLRLPFADADVEIRYEAGMKIPSYFEEYGESVFREVEVDLTAGVLEDFDGILSPGGGAPMTPSTQHALASYIDHDGHVVYLDADPTEATEHTSRGGDRPMFNSNVNSRWRKLFKQCDPVFREVANVHIHIRGLTPQDAAKKVIDMVSERAVHVIGAAVEPYDMVIGEDAMDHLVSMLGLKPAKITLIHTRPVQRHSDRAHALLRQGGYEVSDIVIPGAEPGKTITVANGTWERPGNEGFTRSDAVVRLDDGAATDLAGFVIATWIRGTRYMSRPISLLAIADASTGGKTGVNTPQGKSLVGSFYTPAGVLADTKTLATLPNDIFIEGFGKVAKSGLIRDPEVLHILEDHAAELRAFDGSTPLNSSLEGVVAEFIERTVKVRAYHTSSDLREGGLRGFLNYGCTIGHTIEKPEHFCWRHGNVVVVGMTYAAELVHLIGYIDQGLADYHRSLLASTSLLMSRNGGSFGDVFALMHRDKEARGNELRFMVLDEIGHVIYLNDPPAEAVEEAFRRIRQ